MDEEQASIDYWQAVGLLQEIINSGERGSKEDVMDGLDDDLSE